MQSASRLKVTEDEPPWSLVETVGEILTLLKHLFTKNSISDLSRNVLSSL